MAPTPLIGKPGQSKFEVSRLGEKCSFSRHMHGAEQADEPNRLCTTYLYQSDTYRIFRISRLAVVERGSCYDGKHFP
jgi:hypothetical protein